MTNEPINSDPAYKQTMISAWDQDNSNSNDMRVDKNYLQDSYNPKPVPAITFSIQYKA